jgi:hypothetical protein
MKIKEMVAGCASQTYPKATRFTVNDLVMLRPIEKLRQIDWAVHKKVRTEQHI